MTAPAIDLSPRAAHRRRVSEAARVRADAMEHGYREGKTLRELGALFGVSYERVRQVLKKRGVTQWDRPRRVEVRARLAREAAARNVCASCGDTGCSESDYAPGTYYPCVTCNAGWHRIPAPPVRSSALAIDLGAPVPFATLCAIRAALVQPEPNAPAIARAHGVTLAVVAWAAKGCGVRLGGVAYHGGQLVPRRQGLRSVA